jgi:hypothetical protein
MGLGGRLARLASFSAGVMISRRLFHEAGGDVVMPLAGDLWHDGVASIENELGRSRDVYLGVLARHLLFGDRGFRPERRSVAA